jgi:3-keto-disaccharide hydrolase
MIAALALVALLQTPWAPNSPDRPKPPVVTPGAPPSDAVVLFDGKSLAEWRSADSAGGPAKWLVKDGYMEIAPGSGAIVTRRGVGSVQLHIEWRAPLPPSGEGQERGNSGVFLMSHYEIQVLDSYHNDTYADGGASAIYGQTPPLVNASRPPGEWQTYDIIFHRPVFAAPPDSSVVRPATVTVFHNGVLVHDNDTITGWTVHARVARYRPHPDRLPLLLQDHGARVRYRNIWVRELPETP